MIAPIASGSSFRYEYPNDQDAATLWYHDHAHGRTSRTLYYGLLAFYVLEDDLERELDLPAGDYDVPIVLADHAFNRDGSFRYREDVDVGFRDGAGSLAQLPGSSFYARIREKFGRLSS